MTICQSMTQTMDKVCLKSNNEVLSYATRMDMEIIAITFNLCSITSLIPFLEPIIIVKVSNYCKKNMDEIFEQQRPRVNAELLPKFRGKYVTVLGNAESTKV